MHVQQACALGSAPGSSYISRQQACTYALRSRSRHTHRLKPCPPQSIGFDLPGSTPVKPVERQAEDLSRAASSLLLYRSVLKGGAAVDFLTVISNLQKGSPLTLMESYGSFYRGLVSEDVTSWQDYLLDQILRGVDNHFAREASKLENTDYLLPAVRNDLNVFQTLAVTETTLTTWCKDVAYNVSEDWRIAASSMKQQGGKKENLKDWTVDSLLNNPSPPHVLAPLNKSQRAALRSAIASKWQWGEATELLRAYYAAHDFGIISMHSVLKWTGDRMQAQDVLEGVTNSSTGSSNEELSSALKTFLSGDLTDRSQGHPPVARLANGQILAYNDVLETLSELKKEGDGPQKTPLGLAAVGARLVLLPLGKLTDTLPDLAWTMSQHPRVRFIVLCPGIGKEDCYPMLSIAMAADGFSWPANALFVGCAAPKSGINP